MTGLQKRNVTDDLGSVGDILKNVLFSEGKSIRYLQKRLRSGREIYQTGFHVCEILQERDFNMFSDNRRIFSIDKDVGGFHNSKPFNNVKQCDLNRYVSRMGRVVKYQRTASFDIPSDVKKHSGALDTAVRKFIRCLFTHDYNLQYKGVFGNYKHLLMFIYVVVTGEGYINGIKMENALVSGDKFNLTVNNISNLKRRTLKQGPLKGYRSDVGIFINNIKRTCLFKNFDAEGFVNSYMKNDMVDGMDLYNVDKTSINIKLSKPSKPSKVRREIDVNVDKTL